MILFVDTETTGKADMRGQPHADHQPRLVQLGALLTDEAGIEMASVSLIIKPDGWTIPDEAATLHGITTETATKAGVAIKKALWIFKDLWEQATLVVAHNIQFDAFIIDGEMFRAAGGIKAWGKAQEDFCTMHAMTAHCKLPGNYGDYKWPKLQEAHKHAFGVEFDGAHDAMADVRACAKLYFWIQAQKKGAA